MCTLLQALSTVAQVGQVNAEKQAYKQSADIAEQNAMLANQQANLVQEQKQQQIADINDKKRQTMGTARAAMAANGSDSSMGTGLAAVTDVASKAQRDKNNTEYNADMQSWSYMAQATDYHNQANIYRSNAKNAMVGGLLGAVGSYYANKTPFKSSSNTKALPTTYGSVTKPVSTWW